MQTFEATYTKYSVVNRDSTIEQEALIYINQPFEDIREEKGKDSSDDTEHFTRVCIKDYIHQQMQRRTMNSRKKPLNTSKVPDFNPDEYTEVMVKNIMRNEIKQEKLKKEAVDIKKTQKAIELQANIQQTQMRLAEGLKKFMSK